MQLDELAQKRWRTLDGLASHLGCTVRTIQRRVNSGDVARQGTDDGPRYRVTNTAWYLSRRQATDEGDTVATSGDIKRDMSLAPLAAAVETLATTNAELVRQLEATRAQLDAANEQLTAARHEAVTWRARWHVARGRVDMQDE